MARKTSKCATAKVFQTGRSQAVRIPKEYRFECDEVFIEREGARIILTPRPRSRRDYFGKMRIASGRIFLNGSRISRLSSARSSDAAPDARTQYLHLYHQAPSAGVRLRLAGLRPVDLAISSILAAEFWTGVMKSSARQRNKQALMEFLEFVQVRDWPAEAASIYCEIRARLEAKGRPIGNMDMLIAARALHEQATLVTRNRAEFSRVKG